MVWPPFSWFDILICSAYANQETTILTRSFHGAPEKNTTIRNKIYYYSLQHDHYYDYKYNDYSYYYYDYKYNDDDYTYVPPPQSFAAGIEGGENDKMKKNIIPGLSSLADIGSMQL